LLTGSIIALMLSAQRARSLALQQMEFVAGVSHELRTPLAVIQSAGYNLAQGMLLKPGRVQEYGTVIQTESRRLIDMIEQILSYAGVQSARENDHFHLVEIGPLLCQLMEEYRQRFQEGGWTVEQNIGVDIPLVLGDEKILQGVFFNLLDNALKYAAAGKWLRLSASTNQSRTRVVVTVEDHGPGIDPEDLPKIFKPFYRGRKMAASSIPGAGLGLSILRRYLEALHGHIRVENSPGGGAAFVLSLPAHFPPEP
jgi:signal transduction histidine kinase